VRVGVLGGNDPRRAAAVRDAVQEALQEGRIDTRPRRGPLAAGGHGHGSVPGPEVSAGGEAEPHRATVAPGDGGAGQVLSGVAIVGGGPGDPDLITVRGRRMLAHADVVVADRLAPQGLLAGLGPHVEVVDAAKLPRGRAMAQSAINEVLVTRARQGRFVVRLKGGDPFVFGRGYEEVQACVAAGVPVTVVPGITSAIAVPGLAGIPLTHRGVAHEAVIVSGHLAPDDPASLVDWPGLARLRGTLVLLMAVDRLPEIVAVLLGNGRDGGTPVAVVQDGSLPTERVLRTTLEQAPEVAVREGVRPPAIVVVGGVAALGA
jgi:uroporphyrin-III C-methyltransferase/precorrin-2 dehydrogenase/sirohydrochlorin ferrochelatase